MENKRDYPFDLVEELSVNLGEQFEIRGCGTAVHIDGRLSFPKEAFRLVGEERMSVPEGLLGGRPDIVYTLEALIEGDYDVEYQHLAPVWEREQADPVIYAQRYVVKVRKV